MKRLMRSLIVKTLPDDLTGLSGIPQFSFMKITTPILAAILLAGTFAPLAGQDIGKLRPGSERIDDESMRQSHYRYLHRTSYLLDQPEIQEIYEEALRRYGDPDFHAPALQKVQEYSIGDQTTFYVINFEESNGGDYEYDEITFELRGKADHIQVWVEESEIGPDQVSESIVDGFVEVLAESTPDGSVNPDLGLYELNRELFGEYPNVDDSEILNVLITDIQEDDRDDERDLITLGFFNPTDLNPSHPNSNGADIIYLNSNPYIYGSSFGPMDWHSTLSHEIQHLIHGNPEYNALNTFQNEGQSEMAEILTGFNPRPMTFLSQPSERTGVVNARQTRGLFRWRRGQDEVLQDYERAGLLHTYLAERIGAEAAGSITRSGSSGVAAYVNALDADNLEWEQVLTDFHITNLINREYGGEQRYRYNLHPTLSNLRVRNLSRIYSAAAPPYTQNREVEVQFGGVKYTRWLEVSGFDLTIESGRGMRHKIWYRRSDEDSPQLEHIDAGTHQFTGDYDQFTLISMNVDPGTSENQPNPRTFTYSGSWEAGETQLAELNYAANDTLAFIELPSEGGTRLVGQRITSPLNGEISDLSFRIRRSEEAISGQGTLRVVLHESRQLGTLGDNEPLYGPADLQSPVDEIEIPFSSLGEGVNSVDLEERSWTVEKDTDYIITYSVEPETQDARLQLLADAGQNEALLEDEQTRDFYQPPRTIVLIEENGSFGWGTFQQRNNLDQTVEILGSDPEFTPDFPDPPVAEEFQLKQNYPNPFNPGTQIRYNLHMEIDVVLEVYDVLGRKITTLVDERQEAGYYTVPFDASEHGLSSGMYLYRMRAGSFSDTGKMMYVK